MWYGYDVVTSMNEGIDDYMERHGYQTFDDFRGKALEHFTTPDKVVLQEGGPRVTEDLCIGCGRCTLPAHCEAITMDRNRIAQIDDDECIGCGVCGALCPSGAIEYRAG
jgi:TPP-dependent indolepyruvate ferredoxin oxidoreductase alpha subunit